MALQLITTFTGFSKVEAPRAHLSNKPHLSVSLRNTTSFGHIPTHLTVSSALKTDDQSSTTEKERRSANYIPSIWDYNSLSSTFLASHDYTEAKYGEEVERMKTYVKCLVGDTMNDPLESLELIDVIQRLGLRYHFDADIKHVLGMIYAKSSTIFDHDDLHATALLFRLLRQHGYTVHQDVFKKFMDNESGSFRESLSEDVKGMLSLYEASFLGQTDEAIVDEAMTFSTASLKMTLTKRDLLPQKLCKMVEHALDMPIHWMPNRLEARWFMDEYKDEPCMDLTVLKLAKLDYNIVQSSHQKNVVELTRWWTRLGLSKMSFLRDRLMEHYLWSAFMVFEPQYKAHQIATCKIACMVTIIDDCYDVYGTLDELELLTHSVERWDITEIDRLPPAIRSCFLALYNTTNEIGLELMVESGYNFIPYLHKMWIDLCKSYLQEARWYHGGIKPTFKEYSDNGVISSGVLPMLVTCFLTTTNNINGEALHYVSKYPSIMQCCSLTVRLTNDLGTSSDELARGDNLKAMECYISEIGCTEGAAREHIQNLVNQLWKVMNGDIFTISYPITKKEPLVEACFNLSRATHCFYRNGDGHGLPNNETQQYITSMLVQPVPMDDI